MKRRYAILDVFADTPLEGNPLAVVSDCDGLDQQRMQRIACEFNLSETVFVLPAENSVHSARIRIFTPAHEMPFAGHPTVGTAVLIGLLRGRDAPGQPEMVVVLEEEVGTVRCGVFLRSENVAHAIFDLPRLPEPMRRELDRDAVAGALGLASSEIGFENHLPVVYSAGFPYRIVPVRDLDTLAKAAPNPSLWPAAFGELPNSTYVYCRQSAHHQRDFRARMFAPMAGIVEDPATGSAVAALAGVIHKFDGLRPGSHRFVIEQGIEMGRPSLIVLEIDVTGGRIEAARVGGDAVLIAEGSIDV